MTLKVSSRNVDKAPIFVSISQASRCYLYSKAVFDKKEKTLLSIFEILKITKSST